MNNNSEEMLKLDIKEMSKDIDDVINALNQVHDEMLQAMIFEMVDFGFGVMGIAMRKAPKETGYLRGSATTTVQNIKVAHTEHIPNSTVGARAIKDFKKGTISINKFIREYVGEIIFNTVYATVQHEALDYHHTDGEAKYLEKPLKQQSKKFSQNMAKIIKKSLDRAKKKAGK